MVASGVNPRKPGSLRHAGSMTPSLRRRSGLADGSSVLSNALSKIGPELLREPPGRAFHQPSSNAGNSTAHLADCGPGELGTGWSCSHDPHLRGDSDGGTRRLA